MAPCMVTVIVTTYNHAPFVRQALDSVMAQETSFPFDVVVVDDGSTDGTRGIVDEFVDRYHGQITRTGPPMNQCDNLAFAQAIQGAQCRYVAILDGDDYWTSPAKLRMQVEFLDQNPDCSICFHNVVMQLEDGRTRLFCPADQPRFSTIDDLWQRNFIATCSVMFRQGLIGEFPAWYTDARWGDWPLHLLNAEHGRIGYMDAALGVYRIHRAGLWSQMSDVQQLDAVAGFYSYLNEGFLHRYARQAEAGIARHRRLLVRRYVQLGDRPRARESASAYFRSSWKSRQLPVGLTAGQLLYVYAPPIHGLLRATWRPVAALFNRFGR